MNGIKRLARPSILLSMLILCGPSVVGFSPRVAVPRRIDRRHLPSKTRAASSSEGCTETKIVDIADIMITARNASAGGELDALASRLLDVCAEYGQIGSKLTDDRRAMIDDLAYSLGRYSDLAPAECDLRLRGRHELIYSASPGASSGALGPLVGTVSQSFLDEVRYINRVELFSGLVKIELYAERKALSDTKVRVKFKETAFYLLGNEVKRGEAKGSGVWEYIFSGYVTVDGEKILLRVMKTPSTFVIVQRQGNGG